MIEFIKIKIENIISDASHLSKSLILYRQIYVQQLKMFCIKTHIAKLILTIKKLSTFGMKDKLYNLN